MTEEQFRALIAAGRESESLEAKPGGSRGDQYLAARIVRAALGMTNHEGGGFVIIGIEERLDGTFDLVGIPLANLATWNHDDVSAMINGIAERVLQQHWIVVNRRVLFDLWIKLRLALENRVQPL